MKRTPEILVSKRFLKGYGKAIFKLQRLVEGAIHDEVRRYRSNPKTGAKQYIKGLKTKIREIDVAGAPRLLAHFSTNTLALLDFGDHDVVGEYTEDKYLQDSQTLVVAPDCFWPEHRSTLFPASPDGSYEPQYDTELSKEWIFFLDDDQYEKLGKVLKRIEKFDSTATFLLGGPGTGKTCILLNLLKLFEGSEYKCRISISPFLTQYIETSTGEEISQYAISVWELTDEHVEILLLDDPTDHIITRALESKNKGTTTHVIAAFDPLQLNQSITETDLENWKNQYGVNTYWLSDCYRQKENVGEATKQILDTVARSSPFLAEKKKADYRQHRERISDLANEMNFLNLGGRTQVYPCKETTEDIRKEVNRILRRRDLMWKHAPGLLVLLDNCDLSEAADQELGPLEDLGYVTRVKLAAVDRIKGLEYQHAFIFINEEKYRQLINGFEGTGRWEYEQRRLLRIPFSRAKDSLVVFAI